MAATGLNYEELIEQGYIERGTWEGPQRRSRKWHEAGEFCGLWDLLVTSGLNYEELIEQGYIEEI